MHFLEHVGQSDDPKQASRVARFCSIAPDAVPDQNRLLQLAEMGLASNPNACTHLQNLGAALYRAGQHEAAIQRLNAAEQHHAKTGTKASTWDLLFLAMANFRVGKHDQARDLLQQADQEIERENNRVEPVG